MVTKKAPAARPGRSRKRVSGWAPVRQPHWREQALCAGRDTEVFFPEDQQPSRLAKWFCRRCPVRQDCLAHAIETDERYGVWGGVDEHTRELLVARIRRTGTEQTWGKPGADGPTAA